VGEGACAGGLILLCRAAISYSDIGESHRYVHGYVCISIFLSMHVFIMVAVEEGGVRWRANSPLQGGDQLLRHRRGQ